MIGIDPSPYVPPAPADEQRTARWRWMVLKRVVRLLWTRDEGFLQMASREIMRADAPSWRHWKHDHQQGRELARLRAVEAELTAGDREAFKQLGALRLRVKKQAAEITQMRTVAAIRNRQLAALHIVWCTGTCGSVGCREKVTRELVIEAVRNVKRLVLAWNNVLGSHKGWNSPEYVTGRVEITPDLDDYRARVDEVAWGDSGANTMQAIWEAGPEPAPVPAEDAQEG